VTNKLKILLAITGLMVGGLLLFCSGSDLRYTAGKDNAQLSWKPSLDSTVTTPKNIVTPFSEPPKSSQKQASEVSAFDGQTTADSSVSVQADLAENAISKGDSDNDQAPLQLIDDYMTAWSGNNRAEVQALWEQIGQCPECLQRIKELLMNQGVPKGMLLELTYQIIELGDSSMLPVFDYLLQPSVDVNTRIIITQQMIKDGRGMYVQKLFDILQQADLDGYYDYAAKHTWMISKLKNPQGIGAIFDVMSGRSGASDRFAAHVRNVYNNTLLGTKQRPEMTDAMVNYFVSANATEQANLWGVMALHAESLVALSEQAYASGNVNQFREFSQALADINSVDAVEGMLELVSKVDYSQEYFFDRIRESAQRYNNLETLHKLEDYLRNPNVDMRTRIVATEGLLAVKDLEQARYILQKALNSSRYEDSEIVAYISARL
jgi:hypothetical protein